MSAAGDLFHVDGLSVWISGDVPRSTPAQVNELQLKVVVYGKPLQLRQSIPHQPVTLLSHVCTSVSTSIITVFNLVI